jgi:hypothetical protein
MGAYRITRMILGDPCSVEISAEEYEAGKRAKGGVLALLGIEEKLDLVLENYAEFETGLLEIAARYCLFQGRTWSSSMGELHQVNRRLANLLSSCRLYIDQVKHDLSTLYGRDSTQLEELLAALSGEYDTSLGYRAMEALRNFVQHCALPVHRIDYMSSRDQREEGILVKHTCTPSMNLTMLKEEGRFKAEVLRDLENSPLRSKDTVDLKPLVRECIRSIWSVHNGLRRRMVEDLNGWDSCIRRLISKFRSACGDKTTGLAIVATDGERRIEEVYISEQFSERRKALEQKNQQAGDLRVQYVSSEITRHA